MKLCILDLAPPQSLVRGWARLQSAGRPAEITIQAATRQQAAQAYVQGGALVLGKADGAPRIPLAGFDAFAINGLAPGPAILIGYLQTHGIAGEMADRPQIVSHEMLYRTWEAALEATPLPRLLSLLRDDSPAPILLVPEPMPPEDLLQTDTPRARFCKRLMETGDGPYLRDLAERLTAPHLKGATFLLGQPVETTVQMVLTRQDQFDADGLSPAYGEIILDQMLDALGVARQPRSTITEPTE